MKNLVQATTMLLLFLYFPELRAQDKRVENSNISEKQAVKIAEDFIKRNGYTIEPADTSVHKLSLELMDGRFSMHQLLTYRHDMLNLKAYGTRRSGDAWHIAFQYTDTAIENFTLMGIKINGNTQGRAVIMDLTGKKIRMAHKDAVLVSFVKR